MPSGSELQVLLGNVVVAQLSGDLSQPVLNWTSEWRQGGFLLAPSLPWEVNGLPPSGAAVRNFFENMLPEGMAFDHLLEYAQISRSNSIGLALHLGNDLPGAIRLRTENQFLQGHPDVFRIIAEDELDDRIGRMSAVPIDVWDGKPRLSVAGMQPKLNLLELNGHLGLCDGDRLASDRILKFSSAARPLLLLNECMTMRLAAAAGWPTAKAGMRQVGVHQALEIMRFDRQAVAGTDGNMVVKRRHVIDGCQALGLPSAYKYERNYGDGRDVRHIREGANLLKLFGLASDADNPQAFINNLYDWVLFSIVVGNADAHAKNISFFVGPNGIRPALWYDLLSVVLVPDVSRQLAMSVSDEFEWDQLHALQLLELADEIGRPRSWAQRRLERLLDHLAKALPQAAAAVIPQNAEESDFQQTWMKFIDERIQYWRNEASMMPKIKI